MLTLCLWPKERGRLDRARLRLLKPGDLVVERQTLERDVGGGSACRAEVLIKNKDTFTS